MKRFYIEIPYTGKLRIELEAENEEAALEVIYNHNREELENLENVDFAEVEEDYCTRVVQGNVFYGILNKMTIKEVEEDQD